jgi:hypothetical protein
VFGNRPDDRARAEVDREGDRRFEETIDNGFTIFTDLCSGKVEMEMGHIDRPTHPRTPIGHPGPTTRIAVHPGGLDVHGPIADGHTDMIVRMRVERGGAARGRLVCQREATTLMRAFERGGGLRPLPNVASLSSVGVASGARGRLLGGARRSCPLYFVTTPLADTTSIVAFTIQPRDDRRESLVPQCG